MGNCKHNPNIICNAHVRNCTGCGWDPVEAEHRKQKIRESRRWKPRYINSGHVVGEEKRFSRRNRIR